MPLSLAQENIAQDSHRFRVVVAGRRFGKTHLSIRELCYHARQPNQEVWYVAPTYRQAKQIVWRKLKHKLQDLNWAKKINESELTIVLKNNSVISLKGADNADSLRGVGLDFMVMDEFADVEETAWTEVLRPTLADKQGKALFIGTPKGIGNWAHDLYTMPLENPQVWASFTYTTLDGGQVTLEEIEAAKADLDERTFRQEFMATFETYAGRIYYSFDRKLNCIAPNTIDLSTVYIGMDFNIDPMSAVIAVRQGDSLYVIDEIRMFSSNTAETVEEIKQRYPKSKVWVYPDPAARQRKTSAGGATDITILQNAGFVVKSPNSHTPVRDRINAVNSRLKDAKGISRLFIHPKCKYTIEGLERQTYKEGTTQPDKESGYDHMMDALGYLVDYLFPVRKDIDPASLVPQRWGHRIS
ncbi:phage_term_2, phage terminase, large subunit, PBSX family [uncultured Caudovirales phage]|uniref:Phage_term_2, phage terminase, large subunit, PBSX family n=1 Tax=uncultured Caudovirales phage TaxID=2100421 RepID=A0A6J5N9P1_9CAUD|nr:phage_term_2, phage terminase, large subunit, PBSX family [uncultured Caudovirales phage]